MRRDHLAQLAVFAAVARCGGFRGAAKELAITPSAVSHAVASLEERLSVRLLARTTRSVAPTEAGTRLLERLRPALTEIDGALAAALEAQDRPAGTLRIGVPRTAAQLVLAPKLAGFSAAYPEIVLDLVVEDRFTDMVEAGLDAGIRLGESLQRDMIAVRIGPRYRFAVVGSPAYFATRPRPERPEDLAGHACLRLRFASGTIYRWELDKDGESLVCDVEGPLIVGDERLIVEAALGGAGLACLFEDFVRAPLADGRLMRVLEDWCPPFEGFYLYYPSRRQMRPALRAFVDFFRAG